MPMHPVTPEVGPSPSPDLDAYNSWILRRQKWRMTTPNSSDLASRTIITERTITSHPPSYSQKSLFHPGAEEYATEMTRTPSNDLQRIARRTMDAELFAPLMVGTVEGHFLRMIAQLMRAKRILEIGTFTGYSALAFAEGMEEGEVVTVEANEKVAKVARECLDESDHGDKVRVVVGDAMQVVEGFVKEGERFDLVFLDADKVNYENYYELALRLLPVGGVVVADNALLGLLCDEGDPIQQPLHDFLQKVREDDRVEQVVLTVREGVLIVRKVTE